MNPDFKVNIWDFKDETVEVRLLTLMSWCAALKSELKGYKLFATPVFPIVRKHLSVPKSYPNDLLYRHIQDSYDSIKEQLGV